MKGRTPHIEHQANHFPDVRNEMIAIRGVNRPGNPGD